jgi:hypothetical protein
MVARRREEAAPKATAERIISELPIAVRVYPDLEGWQPDRSETPKPLPDAWLVFDCETRTDKAQALTFGSYRFLVKGRCLEEGLFYGDSLTPREMAVLKRYARTHPGETDPRGLPEEDLESNPDLQLMPVADFRQLLRKVAYKGRALLVAFNFPFDISRLAVNHVPSRGRFLGGFTFQFFQYRDPKTGELRANPYRPGIAVKHMDSKRALKAFTGAIEADEEDLIPEGAASPKPLKRYTFRGHILDAKTLAFALTDRGMSLEKACELFGVEHGKQKVKRHGEVTPKYIDYNRRDVLATCELTEKLLAEYALHPIPLQATKAYSPASIGKAYLRAMGITPILARMPDFPKRYLGNSESAFSGGRASAHVRKVPAPIVYTDFLSQYSSVNVLMGLWRFVTASDIRVVEDAREELAALLAEVTPEWVLDPVNWKRLTGFARVLPDGDVLPLRAKYKGNDWQIGINYVYAKTEDPGDALWYSWPDLVASVLLSGKQPRIVEAFKIEPIGTMEGLRPIEFRGQVRIDPRSQDFFKVVIEERNRLASRENLPKAERDRLKRSLKTFGSATSYGIFAQMDRQESDKEVRVTCYGIDPEPYECKVPHPEAPGEFCFPPLASLITGGSHMLLALLERLVTDRGGTYAMEDTDSMAIVASKNGGLVPCRGGPYRAEDGSEAIRALTWAQVDEIVALIDRLNPYDREAVKSSILKIEDDNFDPKPKKPRTKKQRQLWCLAISAKRYALFLRDRNGEPSLLRKGVNNGKDGEDRWSEHGLGHLLNPSDLEGDDRSWIAQAWLAIVRRSLGLAAAALPIANQVAVGQVSVSSPEVLRPLKAFNAGKPYAQRIRPFNFILSSHIAPFGYPISVDPEHFHLIAPYERDPRKWTKLPWIDQYSGQRYRISASVSSATRGLARVNSYGDVLEEYEFHPEAKCADASDAPCGKQSVGLLRRRHVQVEKLHFIGKESNKLEEVEEQVAPDAAEVYTEYPDPRREELEWNKVVEMIRFMPKRERQQLAHQAAISPTTVEYARRGRKPHPTNRAKLLAVLEPGRRLARD